MKKFLVAVLAVLCLTCIGVVAGCQEPVEPNYYSISWVTPEGISIDTHVPEDNDIRDGVTVSFSVAYEKEKNLYNFTTGDQPNVSVSIGETVETLTASSVTVGENTYDYSFVMTGEAVVRVDGVYLIDDYALTFGSTDAYRISYDVVTTGLEGSLTSGYTVSGGTQVQFRLNVSSYYQRGEGDYSVLSNTQIINPNSDGIYTVTVIERTTITVQGLTEEPSFYSEHRGSGTLNDPFLLRRPIDLFTMAALINDAYFSTFYNCYYQLENDIDMEGEQLFVIGDQISSQNAFFGGNFDGNGHTIKNFYIQDTINDQETFTNIVLPYVGMFGYVAATQSSSANIYNLTLSDFEIVVDDVDAAGRSAIVGGIAGFAVGASITGCTIENATYTVSGDNEYFSYVGGLVGVAQSAYQSSSVNYMSTIVSCAANNVNIHVVGGYIYSAGGIVGQMLTAQEQTPAYIINSYVTNSNIASVNAGNTSLMNAGGLAGVVTAYGAVQNSYVANTSISAYSSFSYEANVALRNATTGGLVGQSESDTVIANSFAINNTLSSRAALGSTYERRGDIAGFLATAPEDLPYISSLPATVFNTTSNASLINDTYIKNTLNWSDGDWVFNNSGYPTVNYAVADPNFSFNLTLNGGAGNQLAGSTTATRDFKLTLYYPLSQLYLVASTATSNYVPEYISTADNNLRSYGYYFDSTLQTRVPNSYIPINNTTLYVGLANYNDVAGTYFFDNNSYVILAPSGIYEYHKDAQIYSTYYIYDSEHVTLYSGPLFALNYNVQNTDGSTSTETSYVSAKGGIADGIMSLNYYDHVNGVVAASPMVAKATILPFQYGEYYDGSDNIYTFYGDGTGTITSGNEITTTFTFASTGNTSITVKPSGGEPVTCTIENGVVNAYGSTTITPFDSFKGVWETQADQYLTFSFDGKGRASISTYTYNENGERELSDTYYDNSYTVNNNNVVSFTLNGTSYTAAFNAIPDSNNPFNDYLIITPTANTDNSYNCYRENSYKGTWMFSNWRNQPITLTLNGIGGSGVGLAVANYNVANVTLDLTYGYNETTKALDFYYLGDLFGTLSLANNLSLTGSFYSVNTASVEQNKTFFLYDSIRGTWLGTFEEGGILMTLEFNGYGLYNVTSTSTHLSAIGSVSVNGTSVDYRLYNGTLTGSFNFRGTPYNFTFDIFNSNSLTINGREFNRPDSLYRSRLYSVSSAGITTYTFDGHGTLNASTAPFGSTAATSTASYGYILNNDSTISLTLSGVSYGTIAADKTKITLAGSGTDEITLRATRPDDMCGVELVNVSSSATQLYKFDGYGKLTVVTTAHPSGDETTATFDYTVGGYGGRISVFTAGTTTQVGTMVPYLLNGVQIYQYTTANFSIYLTTFVPDRMFDTVLYSRSIDTIEEETITTTSTYQFGGNGLLTILVVTTDEDGASTTETFRYNYTIAGNTITLNVRGTDGASGAVYGTIAITGATDAPIYTLTLAASGSTSVTLTTILG